jgi:hypothetical protein
LKRSEESRQVTRINLDCDDGDLGALGQVRAEAQIGFSFTPPVPGILEVVVDVLNLGGSVDVDITDEWWWSQALATLRNYITISVLHPGGPETQVALMDQSSVESDGDNVSAHHNHLNPVQHYMAHLFTAQPVHGGQPTISPWGAEAWTLRLRGI